MDEDKKFYWIKLRTDFFGQDEIDFLMSQKNGSQYVVLYLMLCLQTVNQKGVFAKQIGEILVPYDVEKVVRDTKFFDFDTVAMALELFKRIGLVYEQENGMLKIANIENFAGSESASKEAIKKRRQREKKKLIEENNDNRKDRKGTTEGTKCPQESGTKCPTEYRDKSIEYRVQSKEYRDKSKEHRTQNKEISNELNNESSGGSKSYIQEHFSNPAAAAVIRKLDECGFQINQNMAQKFLSMLDDYGETWTIESIQRASDANVRSVRYVEAILRSWREKGGIDERRKRPPTQNSAADELANFYAMTAEWAEETEGDNTDGS